MDSHLNFIERWCTAPRHRFAGGPAYWEDRCLVCAHWRDDHDHGMHIPWWKFWERDVVRASGRDR